MPGTRHEPAAAACALVIALCGWRALRPLEPALEALQRASGIPVTARLAWWRAAAEADGGTVPLLLALRDRAGERQLTSGRPDSDDLWDIAAVSAGARQALLDELAGYVARLRGPWRLTLSGLRDGSEAGWLAGRLPSGRTVPAPPVPGIAFTEGEVTLAPGIRSGLDRAGHRIRQHALTETIRFDREPARLAQLRGEIEAVHRARDHDAGRVSDLDDSAGEAFWRSVYDRHASRGELEVATLRLDGYLAAYVVALADPPAYRVFDGRFAPDWRLFSPGRRLEVAVVEHARRGPFTELDWMSSVAPEKLVASTRAEPRWAVTGAGDGRLAFTAAGGALSMTAASP